MTVSWPSFFIWLWRLYEPRAPKTPTKGFGTKCFLLGAFLVFRRHEGGQAQRKCHVDSTATIPLVGRCLELRIYDIKVFLEYRTYLDQEIEKAGDVSWLGCRDGPARERTDNFHPALLVACCVSCCRNASSQTLSELFCVRLGPALILFSGVINLDNIRIRIRSIFPLS